MRDFLNRLVHAPDKEKTINAGFDSLYAVEEGYEIPKPSAEQQQQLSAMAVTVAQERNEKGNGIAMDSLFGRKSTEETLVETTPVNTFGASHLQAVAPGASAMNIVVVEPRNFDDSVEIVEHLKSRKSVIVNLQYLDHETSQRVVDFVSGATFAMDGTQERVGNGVFIFASMNCTVETEAESAQAYKDIFAKAFG